MIDDDAELFDVEAVERGAWDPGPYGARDELGTFRELGPHKIAAALTLLSFELPLRTFDLSYVLYERPAIYPTRPYTIELEPQGPEGINHITHLQERATISFNLGTKVNGLHHVGVGDVFYGGRRLDDIVATRGIGDLDTPGWGPPIVTRGFLIDVLGLKLAIDDAPALGQTEDGRPTLAPHYRITVEDLESACERQALPTFEPGDALFIHTGWARHNRVRHLGRARTAPTGDERLARGNPGVWLPECHWLAQFKPAICAADAGMWGTDSRVDTAGAYGAASQLLFVKYGIRVGEQMQFIDLVEAGVDRFAYCHNWLRAVGSVSTNSPPFAIANVPETPH
jgi:Putative cyclase